MERSRSKKNVIEDLQFRVENMEAVPDTRFTTFDDWRVIGSAGNPAFVNAWSNYGSGYQTAAFWKDSAGVVHLRGLVTGGTTTIFTLPVGYRPGPLAGGGTAVYLFGTHAAGAEGRVDVASTGTVTHAGGSNGYVQLDGITFRAEQ